MGKIHEPYRKFKEWLKENDVKYNDLANLLGINVSTITLKINGQSDFFLSEVKMMIDKYNLTSQIFLQI